MSLPDSYVLKPAAIPAYFDAILDAQAPERFSIKFLENLGFTSTNDRLLVGLLKDLGFLNSDGAPQPRYFEFLDRTRSKQVLVSPLTKLAMNSEHVWRTTDASSDWSRSTRRGGHSDGCILAMKPTHGS